jgi:putative transposase
MYLLVPKLRNDAYIPFFINERNRSVAALIQVVHTVCIHPQDGKLAKSLGIESISRSQVSEVAKGLNE